MPQTRTLPGLPWCYASEIKVEQFLIWLALPAQCNSRILVRTVKTSVLGAINMLDMAPLQMLEFFKHRRARCMVIRISIHRLVTWAAWTNWAGRKETGRAAQKRFSWLSPTIWNRHQGCSHFQHLWSSDDSKWWTGDFKLCGSSERRRHHHLGRSQTRSFACWRSSQCDC